MHQAKDASKAYQFIQDGILVVKDGKVECCGVASDVMSKYRGLGMRVKDCSNYLITPGFVDTHIHFPQIDMIGAYGEELLEWLKTYTFPTEEKYSDRGYAEKVSEVFLDEMLRSGTTSALVFCTVHKQSTDALFEAAERRNMLIIAGKVMRDVHHESSNRMPNTLMIMTLFLPSQVMMDRTPFAPESLSQEAKACHRDVTELIEKWHGRGRCLYAVTPRFAITATSEQLSLCGQVRCRSSHSTLSFSHTNKNTNTNTNTRGIYLSIYLSLSLCVCCSDSVTWPIPRLPSFCLSSVPCPPPPLSSLNLPPDSIYGSSWKSTRTRGYTCTRT